MAQDERDSRLPLPDTGPALDENHLQNLQATEATSVQNNNLGNGQTSDSRSIEQPRDHSNSSSDPSTSSSPVPEGSTVGNGVRNVQLGLGIRTLPAWIRSVEYPDDDTSAGVTDQLLPSHPGDAVVAQHNHSPYTTKANLTGIGQGEGSGSGARRESRWKTFSEAIKYPREENWEEKHVAPEWLDKNLGDYSRPWRGRHAGDESEEELNRHRRRDAFLTRFHLSLLKSPIVPLIFRLTVWCFSLIALALGGSIRHLAQKYKHHQGPSALMAIIVDAVALVYLLYITWDEYTSKPLGLRSPRSKARLILLDIFFIVFDSANLSLAFESLSTINGSCTVAEINQALSPKSSAICDRQKALASVLLIALVAWLMTFSISVLRLVEKVAR